MHDVIAIRVPQDSVNDDRVLFIGWLVPDEEHVVRGQAISEIETSKSVMEIVSPGDGILRQAAIPQSELAVGEVLGYVGASLSAIDQHRAALSSTPVFRQTVALEPVVQAAGAVPISSGTLEATWSLPATTRFSQRARAALERLGLRPENFSQRGLVREADVLSFYESVVTGLAAKLPDTRTVPSRESVRVPYRSEPWTRMKRLQSERLAWSTRAAVRSSVTVMVSTAGRDCLLSCDPRAVIKMTAATILFTGELMRGSPAFNACCLGEEIRYYEHVNIGYAMDAGQDLKVPVIRNADLKTIEQIVDELDHYIAEYFEATLRPESQAGATFVISDLSGSNVLTFDPLISEGHSAILGIGGESISSHGQRAYNLILSFDHRISAGRLAARFLNELKHCLERFEQQLVSSGTPIPDAQQPCCVNCGMTLSVARHRNHFLVSVAGSEINHSPELVCTVCLQGR